MLVVLGWIAGCHKEVVTPDAYGGLCTDQMPLAPTFTNVQRLFTLACTTCHTTGVQLVLLPGSSYGNLVNQVPPDYLDPPIDESCGGLLVKPGDPAASYLFQKVSSETPCAGVSMPRNDVGGSVQLMPCEQTLIHDWIAAGAAND